MSQWFIGTTGGGLPPEVAEEFQTQDGNAVPLAHVLIINGFDSTENNDNGIITKGGVVGTGVSNEVDIILTNRLPGTVTTIDATPTTIITFALGATPGVYTFTGDFTAYDITDIAGASYGVTSGVRTDGATATEIGTQFSTNFEEVAMTNADIDVTTSGNNVIFQVTGIAATTIHWDALFNYRFVS